MHIDFPPYRKKLSFLVEEERKVSFDIFKHFCSNLTTGKITDRVSKRKVEFSELTLEYAGIMIRTNMDLVYAIEKFSNILQECENKKMAKMYHQLPHLNSDTLIEMQYKDLFSILDNFGWKEIYEPATYFESMNAIKLYIYRDINRFVLDFLYYAK